MENNNFFLKIFFIFFTILISILVVNGQTTYVEETGATLSDYVGGQQYGGSAFITQNYTDVCTLKKITSGTDVLNNWCELQDTDGNVLDTQNTAGTPRVCTFNYELNSNTIYKIRVGVNFPDYDSYAETTPIINNKINWLGCLYVNVIYPNCIFSIESIELSCENACETNFTCNNYNSCNSENFLVCTNTTDLNFCGTNYTGNYSEFQQNCTYIPPETELNLTDLGTLIHLQNETLSVNKKIGEGINMLWFIILFGFGLIFPFLIGKLSPKEKQLSVFISVIIFGVLLFMNTTLNYFNFDKDTQTLFFVVLMGCIILYPNFLIENNKG